MPLMSADRPMGVGGFFRTEPKYPLDLVTRLKIASLAAGYCQKLSAG
jgi:hypothetical protein